MSTPRSQRRILLRVLLGTALCALLPYKAAAAEPALTFAGTFAGADGARITSSNGFNLVGYSVLVDTVTGGGPFSYVLFSATNTGLGETPAVESLARYDASGALLSSTTLLGNRGGGGIAQDAGGNIYVSDSSGEGAPIGDRSVVKYTKELAFISSAPIFTNNIGPMAWDGTNIFAHADGSWLLRLNTDLSVSASAQYNAQPNFTGAAGGALDGAGNIFLGVDNSSTEPPGSGAYAVRLLKYPLNFADGAAPTLDVAVSTDLLPQWHQGSLASSGGNLFVAATSTDGTKIYLRKFDSSLNYTGVSSTFTNTTAVFGVRLTAGPDGDLYAATTVSGTVSSDAYLAVRYGTDLVQLSSAVFNGISDTGGIAGGIGVVESGSVLVTGASCSGENPGDCKAATVALSLPGGAAGAPDHAFTGDFSVGTSVSLAGREVIGRQVVVDTTTAGGPFIYTLYASTTGSAGEDPTDFLIAKHGPTGVVVASVTVGTNISGGDALILIPKNEPDVYVALKSADQSAKWVEKFDHNLAFVSSAAFSNQAVGNITRMAHYGQNIYLGVDGGTDSLPKVIKLDTSLVEIASTTYVNGSFRNLNGLAIDAAGGIYVTVRPEPATAHRLLRYGPGFPSTPDADIDISGLTSDDPVIAASGDKIYSLTFASASPQTDAFVHQFATAPLAYTGISSTFTSATGYIIPSGQITGHADGDVYVIGAGTGVGNLGAVRLSGVDLIQVASDTTVGLGIAVVDSSQVFVTGFGGSSNGKTSQHDLRPAGGGASLPVHEPFAFSGTFGDAGGARVDSANSQNEILQHLAVSTAAGAVFGVFHSTSGAVGDNPDATVLVKYDLAGALISSRTLGGTQTGDAFAISPDGSMVFVGEQIGNNPPDAIWISRYDGDLVFHSSVTLSTTTHRQARRLAWKANALYAAFEGGTGDPARVFKYDAGLSELASGSYQIETDFTLLNDMAVDEDGTVFIAVSTDDAGAARHLVKFAPSLGAPSASLDATDFLPTDNNEIGLALGTAGLYSVALNPPAAVELRRFNLDLTTTGVSNQFSNYHSEGIGARAQVGPEGDLYVVTTASGPTADLAVIRYDADLAAISSSTFNGSFGGKDLGIALAVVSSVTVYSGGASEGSGTGFDAVAVLMDLSGPPASPGSPDLVVSGELGTAGQVTASASGLDLVWAGVALDTGAVPSPDIIGLVIDQSAGENFLVRVGSTGVLLSSASLGTVDISVPAPFADSAGAIYMGGKVEGGTEQSSGALRKFDQNFNLVNQFDFSRADVGNVTGVDQYGDAVFTVSDGGDSVAKVHKWDTNLVILATQTFSIGGQEGGNSIVVDPVTGDVYATVASSSEGGTVALLRYDNALSSQLSSATISPTVTHEGQLAVIPGVGIYFSWHNEVSSETYIARYGINDLVFISSETYSDTRVALSGAGNFRAADGRLYLALQDAPNGAQDVLVGEFDAVTLQPLFAPQTFDAGGAELSAGLAVYDGFAYVGGQKGAGTTQGVLARFAVGAAAGGGEGDPEPEFTFSGSFVSAGGNVISAPGFNTIGRGVIVDTVTVSGPFIYAAFLSTTASLEGEFSPEIDSIARLDAAGNLLSSATVPGNVGLDGFAVDAGFNVYAGWKVKEGTVTVSMGIAKYDKFLTPVGSVAYMAPTASGSKFTNVTRLTSDGTNVYAANDGASLIKFDFNLTAVATAAYTSLDGFTNTNAVAVAPNGNIYLQVNNATTSLKLLRYPAAFDGLSPDVEVFVSTALFPIIGNGGQFELAFAGGNVYLMGANEDGSAILIRKFDADLNDTAVNTSFAPARAGLSPGQMRVGPDGLLYIVTSGSTTTGSEYAALKYDLDLNMISSAAFSPSGQGGFALGLAVPEEGQAWVIGSSCSGALTGCSARTALLTLPGEAGPAGPAYEPYAFSGTFAVAGGARVDSANNQNELGHHVLVSTVGPTFFTLFHTTSGDFDADFEASALAKYDAAGAFLSSAALTGSRTGDAFTLKPDDNTLFVGLEDGDGVDRSITLARYDANLVFISSVSVSTAAVGTVRRMRWKDGALYVGFEGGSPLEAKFGKYDAEFNLLNSGSFQIGTEGTLLNDMVVGDAGVFIAASKSSGESGSSLAKFGLGLVFGNAVDVSTLLAEEEEVSLAVGAAGLFAASRDTPAGEIRLHKFDHNLNFLGIDNAFTDYHSSGVGSRVQLSPDGELYLVTTASTPTGADYAALRYNSALNLISSATFNGPADGTDLAVGFALLDSSNVFVTGASEGVGTGFDAATVRLNLGGAAPLPVARVWTGDSGFNFNADVAGNWQGDIKPASGERVVLDGDNDMNWNIFGLELDLLTLTTSYTGRMRIVGPNSPGDYNSLKVIGDVLVGGGTLDLGQNSDLDVGGRVDVAGGGLDMGFDQNHLRVGAGGVRVSNGGFFTSLAGGNGFVSIEPVSSGFFPQFEVLDATITVGGNAHLQFDDSGGVLISSLAAINSLSTITWQNFGENSNPALVLTRAGQTALTLNSLEFRDDTSVNVDAAGVPAGSTITIKNAIGARRGSPFHNDPNGVLLWSPDGGGLASFSGTLTNNGTGTGDYHIRAFAGEDTFHTFVTTAAEGAFDFPQLDAPATWYFTAWRSTISPVASQGGGEGFEPRGGDQIPGRTRSRALFVGPSDSVSDISITLEDWGVVRGEVFNNSSQIGPIRVEGWNGDPEQQGPEKETQLTGFDPSLPGGGGLYELSVPATSLYLLAYVDVNDNGIRDAFEAFGTSAVVTGLANVFHDGADIVITGGSAAAGSTGTVTAFSAHPGFIGRDQDSAMLRLDLFAETGADLTLNSLRVDFDASPPASDYGISLRRNEGGAPGPLLAFESRSGGVSTGTLQLFAAETILGGTTGSYFVALDLFSQEHDSGAVLKIAASTYFGLSQGAMAEQPGTYPLASQSAAVKFRVPANQFAQAPADGGVFTGLFVDGGLSVTIAATGQWRIDGTQDPVGPAGKAGTAGQNTVLSAARRGELIGRISGEGGWFRVGTGTAISPEFGGELVLAMNDFAGDYGNNTGSVFADFSISGSTTGAVSGTIDYPGALSANLFVRLMQDCGPAPVGCVPVLSTTTIALSGAGQYPFDIHVPFTGFFALEAEVDGTPTQRGKSPFFEVAAGATTTGQGFTISLGIGSIAGNILYDGVQNFGDFVVLAATHTDFEREVHFVGEAVSTGTAYTMADLETPATYYLVAFRDGNFNRKPDGPEPFGGIVSISTELVTLSNFSQFLVPIYVHTNFNLSGLDVALGDRGGISGDLIFAEALDGTETVVVVAGHGLPGSGSFEGENREFLHPGAVSAGGKVFYHLGLLRPATDYAVFAFVDGNGNGVHDAGENFGFTQTPIEVPAGGFANRDVSIAAPSAPPQVENFFGLALSTTQLRWRWDRSPGATEYHLLDAGSAVLQTLTGSASFYIETLAPNTSSLITGILALNDVGSSTRTSFPDAPLFTLAETPGIPVLSGVGSSSMTVSWAANGNAGATVYDLQRATASAGPYGSAFSVASVSVLDNALAPQIEYFFRVRARNGNGLFTVFSSTASATTLAATVPSIAGLVGYPGTQKGDIILEAYASSGPFSGLQSSRSLVNLPLQPYYMEVDPGSYFVRAFVDVIPNGVRDLGEAQGHFLISTAAPVAIGPVAGPTAGQDFSISVDTIAPAAPSGLTPTVSFGRVDLLWLAPTVSKNGTALDDLAGFRVQRTTVASGPFTTLSAGTFFGVSGIVSSGTLAFADTSPIGGVDNIYRVLAVDYAGNATPSGSLALRPAVGGTVSGSISSFTVTTSGPFRVRLSSEPGRDAQHLAESTLSPFSFSGLQEGTYYLRGFRDTNNNNTQNDGEPSGTHGGTAAPVPLHVFGGATVSGRTVTICDRTPITPNGSFVFGELTATDCPALERGPGNTTDVYTFRVGGGAQGSIARGSRVQLDMFSPSFSPWLFLLGPEGFIIADNNDSGGAFLELELHQEGLYRVVPSAVEQGATGPYDLAVRVVGGSGGFQGTLAGSVSYEGSQNSGEIQLQLFDSPDQQFPFFVVSTAAAGSFVISGMPDGVFYLRAFRDANGNFVRDASEPSGQFGLSASSLTAISVIGGQTQQTIAVTLTDPAVGSLSGSILREGTKSGTIRIEIGNRNCADCSDLETVAFATLSAAGSYTIPFIPVATTYSVIAYLDENANKTADALEPLVSSRPVTISPDATTTLNLLLRDPGFGAAGNAGITGTVSYTGASTGTLFIGFALDAQLESFPYIISQASTGSFSKTGITGNATYYLGAFLDVNGNGSPDFSGALREPSGIFGGDGSAAPLFVPLSSTVIANWTLSDPPGGSISGTLHFSTGTALTVVIEAGRSSGGGEGSSNRVRLQTVANTAVSSYTYSIPFLGAGEDFHVRAFVDFNGNERGDFGEPYGERNGLVTVLADQETVGVDLNIFAAGAGGASGDLGSLSGAISYGGGQPGPVVVQVFTTDTFKGVPRYQQNAPGGASPFLFDIGGVANGTYFLRAFKDANGDGLLDPAFEANGKINGGAAVALTGNDPFKKGLTGALTDVGGAAGAGALTWSGSIEYRGGAVVSTATVQVLLFASDPTAPAFITTRTYSGGPVAYEFESLEPGQYSVRAFLDFNENFLPESSEPLGRGFGDGIFLQGSVSGQDLDLCDRVPLDTTPGALNAGTLSQSDCRSQERSDRPFQDLYTFAGSRGQPVTLSMDATGFVDSFLELYGPRGEFLFEDDESGGNGNAKITNFSLPETGVFTVAARAFAGGVTGGYKLLFQGSGASLGSLGGNVAYSGSQGGRIFMGLFNQPNFDAEGSFIDGREFDGPSAFLFENLATNTSYYLGGFVDVNFNGNPDPGEDLGVFGSGESCTVNAAAKLCAALFLRSGQSVSGIVLNIVPSTSTLVDFASITGEVDYTGAQSGSLVVELFPDPSFTGKPIASRRIPTGAGPYDVSAPGGQPYFMRAFLDADGDFLPGDTEARGVYEPSGQGAESVFLPASGTVAGIDISLLDPGHTAGQTGVSGQGVASLAPSSATVGTLLTRTTIQLLVGDAGIQTGGAVVLGVPPGFPPPQTGTAGAPGFISLMQTNVGPHAATVALDIPAGSPAALARVTSSTPLFAGATLQFLYDNIFIPCFVDPSVDATFFMGSASSGTVVPGPLFSGQPVLDITPGEAAFVRLQGGFFSLARGVTSQALILETSDSCDRPAAVSTPKGVVLRAKTFDAAANAFSDASALLLSTRAALTGTPIATATFAAGRSSTTFFARGVEAGQFALEMFSSLAIEATGYARVEILPTDALSNVSVSTAAFLLGRSSATIIPNGDPATAELAFINFDLTTLPGQPTPNWTVLIASTPFKTGVAPSPIARFAAQGSPSRGQIAWDGRDSLRRRVPKGRYYVRVEVGGGLRDDTLRIDVDAAEIAGAVLDGGVTPAKPLSGVSLDVFGRFSGGAAQTGSQGEFRLSGMAPGGYILQLNRAGYIVSRASITLDAQGRVAGMTSLEGGVLLSSSAAGALRLVIQRAPTLVVVPALQAGDTVAFELSGSLSVSDEDFRVTRFLPLVLPAGTTQFNAGQDYDPVRHLYFTRRQFRFELPAGTYTVRAELPGFDVQITSPVVLVGARTVNLAPLDRRRSISGRVSLAAPRAETVFVSVDAVPLSTQSVGGAVTEVVLLPGESSGTYRLDGLASGLYRLKASAFGLGSVRIASVPVVGADVSTGFPPFADPALENLIVGTITVSAPPGTQFPELESGGPGLRAFISAWTEASGGSEFSTYGSTSIVIATSAANGTALPYPVTGYFTITGLAAGHQYKVFADLNNRADVNFSVDAGLPKRVTISTTSPQKNEEGSLVIAFQGSSGTLVGTIVLPEGNRDFGAIKLFGKTIASSRPEDVGRPFEVDVATSELNMVCTANGAPPTAADGFCPVDNSSAAFSVGGFDTETFEATFLYQTTGRNVTRRISVVNGSTTTVNIDLADPTFSIIGGIVNQVQNSAFNTNAKISALNVHDPLRDAKGRLVSVSVPDVPVSTAALGRVTAIRQNFDTFSTAVSTSFNPATDRVAFIQPGGTFTVRNVAAGVYLLRSEGLRECATCLVVVPRQSLVVNVSSNVSGSSITLSDGFGMAGAISIAGDERDAADLLVQLFNSRQEVVRSTRRAIGNSQAGFVHNSVSFSFSNLPAGEFYTLEVKDLASVPKYVAQPLRFPDASSSPNGLQSEQTGRNVTLQRAAYVRGQLKDANSGLIAARNAALLPPNFRITARANPWVEGGFTVAASSIAGRPLRQDGFFLLGPLLPGVSYDLRFAQEKWDIAFLASGSQNYAPVEIGGIVLSAGETRTLGEPVTLNQGQSIRGTVVDAASTSTALGNIKVAAKPSFGGVSLEVETFTNPSGAFTLWVSSAVSPQYDITAAPRDGNQAASGLRYETKSFPRVTVSTRPLAVELKALAGAVTGQISTFDGAPLSYPFGDRKGFPAAAVFLQPAGVVPNTHPLGDIDAETLSDGSFEIPGLATGTYVLSAVSIGYVVRTASVTVTPGSFCIATGGSAACVQQLTLNRGAVVKGTILLPDGSAPNENEVGAIFATARGFDDFVIGTIEFNPQDRTVSGYTINGFKTGEVYDLVLLPKSGEGDDLSAPSEGQGISFSIAESTTTKTINLTYRRLVPDCGATARALGSNQFQVRIECTRPLRNDSAVPADNNLAQILSVSSSAADGSTLASPDSTGELNGGDKRISANRKTITAVYRPATGETRFSLKLGATFATRNTATGENHTAQKVFDFFTGLESSKKGNVTNARGSNLNLEPTAEDLLLGREEKGGVNIPPGAFGKCQAGDSGCTVDPGLTTEDTVLSVVLEMRKARTREQASVQYMRAYGYVPTHLETLDDARSFPGDLAPAVQAYKVLASTGINAFSSFYDLFLPLGIRTQLQRDVDLTLSYDLSSDTSTTLANLNVWFFNTATGKFEIEDKNRRVDADNKTITVSVDHFSTFVVLGSTPIVTSVTPFSGGDIDVFNFPNPFDCTPKTKSLNNRVTNAGQVTFNGTLIRYSLPTGQTDEVKFRIYNVAGELVREFSQGSLAGGFTYYSPWDCKNQGGVNVASGVYIGQVQWGGKSKFFKMALIKGSGR